MTHPVHCVEPPVKERLRYTIARLGMLGFLLFVSSLLVACNNDANERARRILDLQLRASDLPPGWQRTRGAIGDWDQEREGIISRSIGFLGAPEEQEVGALVTQELIDYPSTTQAGDAYQEIVSDVIPNEAWTWPEQVDFQPQADQIHLACRRASPENSRCRSVAQYGHYISIIRANVFTDKWFTMKDLDRLLESIDTRLAAATDEN
jgi:hypothetical protein